MSAGVRGSIRSFPGWTRAGSWECRDGETVVVMYLSAIYLQGCHVGTVHLDYAYMGQVFLFSNPASDVLLTYLIYDC
jgi:hypothetical protein